MDLRRALLLAAGPLLSVVAGVAVAAGVAGLVEWQHVPLDAAPRGETVESDDLLSGLFRAFTGAAWNAGYVAGLAFALVVGLVVWVAGVVLSAQRVLPESRRARAVLLTTAVGLGGGLVCSVAVAESAGGRVALAVGTLLFVGVASSAVFPLVELRGERATDRGGAVDDGGEDAVPDPTGSLRETLFREK